MRQGKLVDNAAHASCYRRGTYIHVGKAKFCYLVILDEKFLTRLAAALIPQND